jgi:hypothetical protein
VFQHRADGFVALFQQELRDIERRPSLRFENEVFEPLGG